MSGIRTKRLSSQSYLSADQITAAYALYRKGDLSTYEIAEQIWEQLGYCDAYGCATAIRKAFKFRGYRLRSRSAARKLAMKKRFPEVTNYERYERRMGRAHQPLCGQPSKRTGGSPCRMPQLLDGTGTCAFHRPEVPEERRCHGENNRGERCKRLGKDDGYCLFHTPALQEAA